MEIGFIVARANNPKSLDIIKSLHVNKQRANRKIPKVIETTEAIATKTAFVVRGFEHGVSKIETK